jgi:hypothetical protein
LYIGEIDQIPVGIVRFDFKKENKEAEVSINLSSSMRGKGLGKELLISSIDNIEVELDVKLVARVKIKNIASVNVFQSAGFLTYKEDDGLIYLSRPVSEVQFKKVDFSDTQALYDLLKKRIFSISHSSMPSRENHKNFVESNPYKHWYIIYKNKDVCGSFYIKKDNSVGLNLIEPSMTSVKKTISFIKSNFSPETSIPSKIPSHFFINVSYTNEKLSNMLSQLGFNPIQISHKL